MRRQGKMSVSYNLVAIVQSWLDSIEVRDPALAHRICQLIPSQCPFERDIKLFNRTILHIPALCKFNPVYEQLVGLRYKSLCFLADDCGEDISAYLRA